MKATFLLGVESVVIVCDEQGGGVIEQGLERARCPFCNSESCEFSCYESQESEEANTKHLEHNAAIDVLERTLLALCASGVVTKDNLLLVRNSAETVYDYIGNTYAE